MIANPPPVNTTPGKGTRLYFKGGPTPGWSSACPGTFLAIFGKNPTPHRGGGRGAWAPTWSVGKGKSRVFWGTFKQIYDNFHHFLWKMAIKNDIPHDVLAILDRFGCIKLVLGTLGAPLGAYSGYVWVGSGSGSDPGCADPPGGSACLGTHEKSTFRPPGVGKI